MKRIAIASIMVVYMCCAGVVTAQRPVGDTIFGRDSTFFYYPIYDWIGVDDRRWGVENGLYGELFNGHQMEGDSMAANMHPGANAGDYDFGNKIYGVQLFTERPLKVVGIAAAAYMQEPHDTIYDYMGSPVYTEHHLNTRDTTLAGRVTDSMILYKPVNGGLVKLTEGPWRIENPHRYIVLPPRLHGRLVPHVFHQPIDDTATSYISPLYEVMFEKPVVVEDSFVVAATTFNNEGHKDWEYGNNDIGRYYMWLWDHNPTRLFFFFEYRDEPTPELVVWEKFRTLDWRYGRGDDSISDYGPGGASMQALGGSWLFSAPIILPIIEPEFDTTLCHEVSNLRVAERGAGCATLMWDAGDGGPWVVAYGKITDAWEDFTFDTVTSPMLTLTGLEVGTQYFALVRGYCSVTGEYGEWTNPLEVEIYQPGSGPEPEGIDRPGDLGRFTRLMPNPAREQVSVLSSYKMSRIEVYALDGRKVLEQEVGGISTVAEVKDLPRGTYIMAVYLPHGVATKKLVLE